MRLSHLTLPLLLLLLGACECGRKPPQGTPLATLVLAQGDVTVLRGAERLAGREQLALFAGDTLVTGPGATARVRYVNGAEVQVGEKSRLRVNGTPAALSLEIEEGQIISSGPEGSGASLTVKGRFGQAELMTAAEMVFDLSQKEPRLTLEFGEIRVVDAAGQPVEVVQGEELVLTLDKPQPPAPPKSQEVLVADELLFTLESRGGKARVRGPQESTFSEVAPGKARELPVGSAFEVPARASARLVSDALKVELSGESAGALTAASRQGEQRDYGLRLPRGQARLQFASGKQQLKLADAQGDVELRVSEQSTVSVRSSPEGARLTVLTGEVELVADGQSTRVGPGQQASRSGKGFEAAAGPAPALELPADATVRVFTNAPPAAAIRVPPSSGEPLRVEVASEPDFREPLLAGRAGAERVRLEAPGRGELHWRFLAPDGSVRARGGAVFQPDRSHGALAGDSPRAEVMETGLKASIYFQGAMPSLHFSYSGLEGARAYRIRVFRAGNLDKPLLERKATRTDYTLEPGALREGSYLWYVAALGPSGEELSGGRMNKLELVYDNSRRGLALRRPRPGERVGRGPVLVEGVAPLGSRLSVNDTPLTLDAKGRFSQRVPPADVLVFRLASEQGEAYWVRTLRSNP